MFRQKIQLPCVLWRGAMDYREDRQTRIVHLPLCPGGAGLGIEVSHADLLGSASWSVPSPYPDDFIVARMLATALLDLLGARPTTVEAPPLTYEIGSSTTAVFAVLNTYAVNCPDSVVGPGSLRLAIAQRDGLGDDCIVRTVLEEPYVDAAGIDGWAKKSWLGSGLNDVDVAETTLGYAIIHALGLEPDCESWEVADFEKGISRLTPDSGLVAPSRYVPCKCGITHEDRDYELVIGCRHCGNVIGPAY